MPVSAIHSPTQCALFFALLYREDLDSFEQVKNRMAKEWGVIIRELSPTHFPMKEYYTKEMGAPLGRTYLVVEGKWSRDVLIKAKQWAMNEEEKTSIEAKRTINIDPGILCLEQMLLISTKPYSHRIHITENLYAELTYQFQDGTYRPLPWTYPDYLEEEVLEFFTESRKIAK